METTQQKKPSYLSKVKEELLDIIISRPVEGEQGVQEYANAIWAFVSGKLAESYWNGVSAGSSGRVKPRGPKSFNSHGKPTRA